MKKIPVVLLNVPKDRKSERRLFRQIQNRLGYTPLQFDIRLGYDNRHVKMRSETLYFGIKLSDFEARKGLHKFYAKPPVHCDLYGVAYIGDRASASLSNHVVVALDIEPEPKPETGTFEYAAFGNDDALIGSFDSEFEAEIAEYWYNNLDSMRGYNRYLAEPIGVQDYSAMECQWVQAPAVEIALALAPALAPALAIDERLVSDIVDSLQPKSATILYPQFKTIKFDPLQVAISAMLGRHANAKDSLGAYIAGIDSSYEAKECALQIHRVQGGNPIQSFSQLELSLALAA